MLFRFEDEAFHAFDSSKHDESFRRNSALLFVFLSSDEIGLCYDNPHRFIRFSQILYSPNDIYMRTLLIYNYLKV